MWIPFALSLESPLFDKARLLTDGLLLRFPCEEEKGVRVIGDKESFEMSPRFLSGPINRQHPERPITNMYFLNSFIKHI